MHVQGRVIGMGCRTVRDQQRDERRPDKQDTPGRFAAEKPSEDGDGAAAGNLLWHKGSPDRWRGAYRGNPELAQRCWIDDRFSIPGRSYPIRSGGR